MEGGIWVKEQNARFVSRGCVSWGAWRGRCLFLASDPQWITQGGLVQAESVLLLEGREGGGDGFGPTLLTVLHVQLPVSSYLAL